MEKNNFKSMRLISIFCFVICVISASPSWAEEKVYTLSYSEGTLFHRLVRDRTKILYQRAGLKAEFIPLPHNRSLISANEDIVDGDVGRVPSVEENYPNLVRVNVKLMDLNGAVYTSRNDIQQYTEDLLKEFRVGYVLGVLWPQKRMKGLQAVTVRDSPSLFEMILQGRVDLVLATEASARSALKDMGGRAVFIHKLEPFVFTAPIYHYLNKKHTAIIPLLEMTLIQMNKEGDQDE